MSFLSNVPCNLIARQIIETMERAWDGEGGKRKKWCRFEKEKCEDTFAVYQCEC